METTLAEAIREYRATGNLNAGLQAGRKLIQADQKEQAYRLFDILYLGNVDTFPDRVKGASQEYHADITETVTYHDQPLIRREYQALEAMAQRASRRAALDVSDNHLRSVSLSNSGLQEVPEELIQLPYLQKLYLANNQLTTPQGLPNLPQLTDLILTGTPLTTLQGLPNLPQLKSLDLRVTPLTTLTGLPNLPKLECLDLNGTPIETLQDLPPLEKLREIWIRGILVLVGLAVRLVLLVVLR